MNLPTNPNQLLQKTKELNQHIEETYILLGLALSQVEKSGAYKQHYDSFAEYFTHELGRSKATVSRLISVADWVQEHKIPTDQIQAGYSNIYEAILALPDKEPELVLSWAATNTVSEIREKRSENEFGVHDHEPDLEITLHPCKTCGRLVRHD